MSSQFPLESTSHELDRGVDPRVAADIGYQMPYGLDISDPQEEKELRNAFIERTDGPLIPEAASPSPDVITSDQPRSPGMAGRALLAAASRPDDGRQPFGLARGTSERRAAAINQLVVGGGGGRQADELQAAERAKAEADEKKTKKTR